MWWYDFFSDAPRWTFCTFFNTSMDEWTTLPFLIEGLHFLFIIWIFFSIYMVLLGPTGWFIFGKSSHLHAPIKKTSHLHGQTLIRNSWLGKRTRLLKCSWDCCWKTLPQDSTKWNKLRQNLKIGYWDAAT